jgi:hypothetical protein
MVLTRKTRGVGNFARIMGGSILSIREKTRGLQITNLRRGRGSLLLEST